MKRSPFTARRGGLNTLPGPLYHVRFAPRHLESRMSAVRLLLLFVSATAWMWAGDERPLVHQLFNDHMVFVVNAFGTVLETDTTNNSSKPVPISIQAPLPTDA